MSLSVTSSTEDEGAYVGASVEFEVACFGASRSRTALDRWATTRPWRFGPVEQEDHGGPRRFDRCERGDRLRRRRRRRRSHVIAVDCHRPRPRHRCRSPAEATVSAPAAATAAAAVAFDALVVVLVPPPLPSRLIGDRAVHFNGSARSRSIKTPQSNSFRLGWG